MTSIEKQRLKQQRRAAKINKQILKLRNSDKLWPKEISDGNHTFDDLYNHRMVLTSALTRSIFLSKIKGIEVYKSKLHHDGTMQSGNFIVCIEYKLNNEGKLTSDKITPKQISYHYKLSHWDKFDIPERERSSVYDGHTPEITLIRLLELFGA